MSSSYKYLDPDYSYIEPKTGTLRNLIGISDAKPYHLLKVEQFLSDYRNYTIDLLK